MSTALDDDLKHPTIFVSVPSYRDPECTNTVVDALTKAQWPNRVFVGVCQQNNPEDLDVEVDGRLEPFRAQVRIMRLTADEAKGPVYARALIEQSLYRQETFYLMIDSHTLFSPNWDVECIRQLTLCRNYDADTQTYSPAAKPVLTCYPSDFDREHRRIPGHKTATFLKLRDFHPRLKFTQQDPVTYKTAPTRPQPSLLWGAGFSFTLGQVIQEVPCDPNLLYTFLGEEITMAARLYCAGWDTFAPMTNLVYHYSPRTYRPVFWEQFYKNNGVCQVSQDKRLERRALEKQGNARMHRLLADQVDDAYGLKSTRSLKQFEDFTGLDLANCQAKRHAYQGLTRHPSPEEMRCKLGIETGPRF